MSDTVSRMRRALEERFHPSVLEIRDDSALHAGHPGAAEGGGHFHVTLVAAEFEGLPRIEQHRLVYGALHDLVGGAIHALALTTCAPSERGAWDPG